MLVGVGVRVGVTVGVRVAVGVFVGGIPVGVFVGVATGQTVGFSHKLLFSVSHPTDGRFFFIVQVVPSGQKSRWQQRKS